MDCCHSDTVGNMNHNHHAHQAAGHGMGHGDASMYIKRFWIVTFLLIPLLLTHGGITDFFGIGILPYAQWIGFGIATVIFGFAFVFFEHALHEIKAKKYGMMTLVSLAVGSGYLFSVVSTFVPALETEFYLEISTLIWVLLFGHYLEAKSSNAAGDALGEVAKLLPKQAHKLIEGGEIDVTIDTLREGDMVLVKPGEKVPADGRVSRGSAHVDESLISGESKPIHKTEGDQVVAGSICLDGSLTVKLLRVGEHSTIGQIQKLISEAGHTKPRSQRIADRAAAILTFVAGITAIVALLVWTLIIGEPFVFGMTLAITVLVIACPHALGLAIPTVTTIATSLAVKNGFFIKDLAKIEILRKADYIVFDKTGTLTEGKFGVTRVVTIPGGDEQQIVRIAASLEQHSSHVIGTALMAYAKEQRVTLDHISDFKNIAGQGVQAKIGETEYKVGNERLVSKIMSQEFDVETEGTRVYVADHERVLGYIVLADAVKPSAYNTVAHLHAMGIKVAILTGDNERVAQSVAEELSIDTYIANVLPEDKYVHIKKLQNEGNTVVMVGDGVNDAPALTQADVGVAIGAGTDVAIESGDVVLMQSDPMDVVKLVRLSKSVYIKMIQNLVWALGYNIVALPAAAGAFASFGFFLRPEVGALLMSGSTVIVVLNALLLKRVTL